MLTCLSFGRLPVSLLFNREGSTNLTVGSSDRSALSVVEGLAGARVCAPPLVVWGAVVASCPGDGGDGVLSLSSLKELQDAT